MTHPTKQERPPCSASSPLPPPPSPRSAPFPSRLRPRPRPGAKAAGSTSMATTSTAADSASTRAMTPACATVGSSIGSASWCSAGSTSATRPTACQNEKPRPRASETGVFFSFALGSSTSLEYLSAGSGEVKAIGVHHLGPRRHEVLRELLLRVRARVDLRKGTELRVGTEDQVDAGAGPLDRLRLPVA